MPQAVASNGNIRGLTRSEANRAIRQEALREQLATQGHLQHVSDIAHKLNNLEDELDSTQVMRLKAAADIKLKLIDKYLPSLKSVEHTGQIEHRHRPVTEDDIALIHKLRSEIDVTPE